MTTPVPVWVQESTPKFLAFTSTDLFAAMLALNAGLVCTALAAPKHLYGRILDPHLVFHPVVRQNAPQDSVFTIHCIR